MGMYLPFIFAGITLGMMIICWIPILKIGLKFAHSEVMNGWKGVVGSASLQAGAVFFIMFPIFLDSFLGEMQEGGPDIPTLLGLMSLGLLVDLNLINVLHRIGIKRAIIIFIVEIIPVIIIMTWMFSVTGDSGGGPSF